MYLYKPECRISLVDGKTSLKNADKHSYIQNKIGEYIREKYGFIVTFERAYDGNDRILLCVATNNEKSVCRPDISVHDNNGNLLFLVEIGSTDYISQKKHTIKLEAHVLFISYQVSWETTKAMLPDYINTIIKEVNEIGEKELVTIAAKIEQLKTTQKKLSKR